MGAVSWKPCSGWAKRRWRPSPGGLKRNGTCTRGQGGRARRCLRPSPRGPGETELAPEAKGLGEPRFGPEVEGQMCWDLRPGDGGWLSSSFAFFIALIWVSLFMVPNSSPRAFEGVSSPLQRFFLLEGPFFVDWELFLYFLQRVRASAPAGCSPRAFWRNGVIPSKAFTPE